MVFNVQEIVKFLEESGSWNKVMEEVKTRITLTINMVEIEVGK